MATVPGIREGISGTVDDFDDIEGTEMLPYCSSGSDSWFWRSGVVIESLDYRHFTTSDVFSGNRADYNIALTASGYSVSGGPSGEEASYISGDIVVGRLLFADKNIAIDLASDGHAGQALEFIGMLDHSSINNPRIVGDILRYFDNGSSMTSLCQQAINIGLIDQLAGSSSDLDLARLVYRNVVGSEADGATAQALAGLLQTSGGTYSRADFLASVATLELNQTHIDLVGLQQTGVEYL